MPQQFDRADAKARDRADPLGSFRERFYIRPGTIYLDGNSLGPLSRDAEAATQRALAAWRTHGIGGWLEADPPWFCLGEELGRRLAALVGAKAEEVVATATITVNLHALVATFYEPVGARRKILATELDFPSDIYALSAQIALRGGDPARDLVKAPSRDGTLVDEDDIIAAMTDDVALVLLPSVFYRSGQLLDIERLTAAAHERGILIGFDCAHSVGVVPHRFDAWDVDFAIWCNYKYLNAGPGSVGALYVNERHFGKLPALPGWWGYQKERQFDMLHEFEGAGDAGAWQISTVPVLSAAPLLGSLDIFEQAGIEHVRASSLAKTDFLIALLEQGGLLAPPYNYGIATPRAHARRGGHVAVEHAEGPRIARALKARGVIPDFRPPNIVRLAPVPLYVSYVDIWEAVRHLREIVDSGEYLTGELRREVVA